MGDEPARRGRLAGAAVLVTAVLLTAVAACGADGGTSTTATAHDDGRISVVASTDVWGDIAATIGGARVDVTSVISKPDADPHEYEANAGTALALSRAHVVIENGGGYDDFMGRMLAASHNTTATVLDAVAISGRRAGVDGELNEHVWYDVPTVATIADRLAATFGAIDPAHAKTFTGNATAFTTELASLRRSEAAIARSHRGAGVAITEPVPGYLLDACGLVDKTPDAFSAAVEDGSDVSPRVLAQTLALFTRHRVEVLVYNAQTTGAPTTKVLYAAAAAGIPVVPVTETLPPGEHYIGWMASNLAAIQTALAR